MCVRTFCNTCRRNVDKYTHLCFLQPHNAMELHAKQVRQRGIFLFLDMECLREEDGNLKVNLIVVQDEFANKWVFEGLESIDHFADSLFNEEGELFQATLSKYKYARFFAHNGSRFDYFPFVDKIAKYTAKDPDIIFDGSSILFIKTFEKHLHFMDSRRFIPMRLEQMPGAFGVTGVKKGFFPYRLNNRDTCDRKVERPMREDFETQLMSAAKRDEFEKWYVETIENPYLYHKELKDHGILKHIDFYDIFKENLAYCRDDVRVLRVCFLKFFEACFNTTKLMFGVNNLTIASYCNMVLANQVPGEELRGVDTSQKLPAEGRAEQDCQHLAEVSRRLPLRRSLAVCRQEPRRTQESASWWIFQSRRLSRKRSQEASI